MTNLVASNPDLPPPPPVWVNKMMTRILRSPLHGMVSKSIMLISVTGRKSGKKYMIPVTYVRDGDLVRCSTNRTMRSWWKNLRGGANVTVWLRGKEVTGHAFVIYDDLEAIAKGIEMMLTAVPSNAKYYNVRMDEEKRPFPEDVAQATQRNVIVEIKI